METIGQLVIVQRKLGDIAAAVFAPNPIPLRYLLIGIGLLGLWIGGYAIVLRQVMTGSAKTVARVNLFSAILSGATVHLWVGYYLYRFVSTNHRTDYHWALPTITLFLALQLPWLTALGAFRQTQHLCTEHGIRSETLLHAQAQASIRLVASIYLALTLALISMVSILRW